eukprot:2036041-Pyramimonas_sp.AAC.1
MAFRGPVDFSGMLRWWGGCNGSGVCAAHRAARARLGISGLSRLSDAGRTTRIPDTSRQKCCSA